MEEKNISFNNAEEGFINNDDSENGGKLKVKLGTNYSNRKKKTESEANEEESVYKAKAKNKKENFRNEFDKGRNAEETKKKNEVTKSEKSRKKNEEKKEGNKRKNKKASNIITDTRAGKTVSESRGNEGESLKLSFYKMMCFILIVAFAYTSGYHKGEYRERAYNATLAGNGEATTKIVIQQDDVVPEVENEETNEDKSEIKTISSIIDYSRPSVVSISEIEGRGNTKAIGSGIVYKVTDTDFYILTSNHVVTEEEMKVQWFSGAISYGDKIWSDKEKDLAILAVSKKYTNEEIQDEIRTIQIGDSDEITVGDGVIAMGNALGEGITVTNGIISGKDKTVDIGNGVKLYGMFQTNAQLNPGNSGGPLLNEKGELIGINTAKYDGEHVEGIGYAIPINAVISCIGDSY